MKKTIESNRKQKLGLDFRHGALLVFASQQALSIFDHAVTQDHSQVNIWPFAAFVATANLWNTTGRTADMLGE